ncbi:hypothetical protein C1645_839780 [Glomus cerebriforme]|uniref:Uncharacterized protein n=1 Tax=Glomus cerebriforme TaxID=658196 RepID=A0A397S534_9GLOM|nr:hypothetical protein C1645_839780 [Glomus cerebriforme]
MSVKSSQSQTTSRKLRSSSQSITPSTPKSPQPTQQNINNTQTNSENNGNSMEIDNIDEPLNSTTITNDNSPNRTTTIINNTIESPMVYDTPIETLQHSSHNPNTSTSPPISQQKGKNKETYSSIPNPEIIAPVKIAHRFNEISQTPQILNNRDNASNSELDEIDIADIQLSSNANQYIAFTPYTRYQIYPFWMSNSQLKTV